ncbi:hypothetical protein SAMN05443144_1236 [Fodinibius roseus]|uniref:Glycosyltransferase n=2 Tax=Fodinibius roseus TaxID=1194090 RepID=A0A1M5ID72_9BACT|nr:hypothetical protein SAMN05443144_1236 [Fodinibius roseus]
MGPTLLIFIKNPERGKVKTRLAETAGDDTALEVYQKLLRITQSVTDQMNIHREVWYSRFIEQNDIWSGGQYKKKRQRGKDLGGRMKLAFREAFARGSGRVVIIGSDCPGLRPPILRQAFRLLRDHKVVVGPARDGGYYLLGMKEFYPALFDRKKWSTSAVCEQTIQQLDEMKVSYRILPELNDIDTQQDLDQSKHLSV